MNHTLAVLHLAVDGGAVDQAGAPSFLDDAPQELARRQLGVQHRCWRWWPPAIRSS